MINDFYTQLHQFVVAAFVSFGATQEFEFDNTYDETLTDDGVTSFVPNEATQPDSSNVVKSSGVECTEQMTICATDLRSNGPQNFDSECHMREENGKGGRECLNIRGLLIAE